MKTKHLALLAISSVIAACASNPKDAKMNGPVQKFGTVKQVLFNPNGDADGLILIDGMQVSFAPRAADDFTKVITSKDPVEINGIQENEKRIRADGITNSRTSRSIANIAALPEPKGALGAEENIEPLAPVPPHFPVAGPGPAMPSLARKPLHPPARGQADVITPMPPVAHENLRKISIHGTVQTKLYDSRGEINGIVLKDDSIVRFTPNLLNESRTRVELGDDLTAFGYGTENARGKFIQATEMTIE
ncbi:MAG: hypothetical protein H7256_07705 [Bdellovibrio sp.]|nr:hypothetical protein [Bdellovibrio sp.]